MYLFVAAGMTQVDFVFFMQYVPRATETIRIMYEHMCQHAIKAVYRPVARMQLIRAANNRQQLGSDRVMWMWAAVWTIKMNIQQDLHEQGYLMGICLTCALYTGCWCDGCGGPRCTICDDEDRPEHQCTMCEIACEEMTRPV